LPLVAGLCAYRLSALGAEAELVSELLAAGALFSEPPELSLLAAALLPPLRA
jgi:hypothetical protein